MLTGALIVLHWPSSPSQEAAKNLSGTVMRMQSSSHMRPHLQYASLAQLYWSWLVIIVVHIASGSGYSTTAACATQWPPAKHDWSFRSQLSTAENTIRWHTQSNHKPSTLRPYRVGIG